MANSDKNLIITPNIGSSTDDPKIVFSGANSTVSAQNITARVYPTSNGTLSFEGTSGQLFSITNSLTGTIFSVNDVSGIPSIAVQDTGLISMAPYSGNVSIGSTSDQGYRLYVGGSLSASTVAAATGSFSGSQSINTTTPGTAAYQLNFIGGGTSDYAQAMTWAWSSSGVQAGIYVQSSGSYGTKMYLATTDSFATGSKTALSIDHTGLVQTTRNYLQAYGSVRAPVFYDSDDTGYYIDPNNYSFLYSVSVNVGNEGLGGSNSSNAGLVLRGNYNSNTWAHKFHKLDNGSGVALYLSQTAGTGSWSGLQGWGSGLGYTTVVYGSLSADSLYSPIFYDRNDTGYYVDPNSTSNISILNVTGNWATRTNPEAFSIRGTYPSLCFRATNGSGQYWLIHNDAGSSLNWYSSGSGTDGGSWNRGMWIDTSGNLTCSGNITAYSDVRLKTNIETFTKALDTVKQLRGVRFEWIDSGKKSIGLIAQEVELVLPELIITSEKTNIDTKDVLDNIKSLDYSKIIGVLIEAIKEQQTQIEELKAQLK